MLYLPARVNLFSVRNIREAMLLYDLRGFKTRGRKRVITPGKGHEEMVLAVKGNFEISGRFSGRLGEGCAFHVAGEDTVYLQNAGAEAACYVIAGGHSPAGHHH